MPAELERTLHCPTHRNLRLQKSWAKVAKKKTQDMDLLGDDVSANDYLHAENIDWIWNFAA